MVPGKAMILVEDPKSKLVQTDPDSSWGSAWKPARTLLGKLEAIMKTVG
jgi:hypothetical protein